MGSAGGVLSSQRIAPVIGDVPLVRLRNFAHRAVLHHLQRAAVRIGRQPLVAHLRDEVRMLFHQRPQVAGLAHVLRDRLLAINVLVAAGSRPPKSRPANDAEWR